MKRKHMHFNPVLLFICVYIFGLLIYGFSGIGVNYVYAYLNFLFPETFPLYNQVHDPAAYAALEKTKDIIGIFDADTSTVSAVTKKYLSLADGEGTVNFASEEIPKSFVLYLEGGEYKICFSQLSSSALKGRMNSVD